MSRFRFADFDYELQVLDQRVFRKPAETETHPLLRMVTFVVPVFNGCIELRDAIQRCKVTTGTLAKSTNPACSSANQIRD